MLVAVVVAGVCGCMVGVLLPLLARLRRLFLLSCRFLGVGAFPGLLWSWFLHLVVGVGKRTTRSDAIVVGFAVLFGVGLDMVVFVGFFIAIFGSSITVVFSVSSPFPSPRLFFFF